MIKWIFSLLIVYLFLLGLLYFFQRHFIYFPQPGNIKPDDWNLPTVKLVQIKTQDNVILNAWFHAPSQGKMPIILYLHGNFGHLGYRAQRIRGFVDAGYGLLLLSYRGYGGSTGNPSEEGLYQDARAAIHFLNTQGIHTQCIVLFGESLGTGVAVQMATEFQVGALILQSAYTSLVDVGKRHYPIFPVNHALKDRFDSIRKIKKINIPILFIHGNRDAIIPAALAKILYAQANEPKIMHIYPHAGHNDLPDVTHVVDLFLKKYGVCKLPKT